MAWKIERWLSEVFPGEDRIYSEYRTLPSRELAIVAAAVLDVGLAELLALRLTNHPKEIESFIGADGDGRAPAGSFGARIQLGVLVGLLTPDDASVLRTIKDLRNIFAHRVRVTFVSPSALKYTTRLHELMLLRSEALIASGAMLGSADSLRSIAQHLPTVPEAGEGLLLSTFTIYQAYFRRLHARVQRLGTAIPATTQNAVH